RLLPPARPQPTAWFHPPQPGDDASCLEPDDAKVFTDDALGAPGDVWVALRRGDGSFEPAFFVGTIERDVFLSADGVALRPRIGGDEIQVELDGATVLTASLADARRDTDRDGLPDIVEQRLHLDPT